MGWLVSQLFVHRSTMGQRNGVQRIVIYLQLKAKCQNLCTERLSTSGSDFDLRLTRYVISIDMRWIYSTFPLFTLVHIGARTNQSAEHITDTCQTLCLDILLLSVSLVLITVCGVFHKSGRQSMLMAGQRARWYILAMCVGRLVGHGQSEIVLYQVSGQWAESRKWSCTNIFCFQTSTGRPFLFTI